MGTHLGEAGRRGRPRRGVQGSAQGAEARRRDSSVRGDGRPCAQGGGGRGAEGGVVVPLSSSSFRLYSETCEKPFTGCKQRSDGFRFLNENWIELGRGEKHWLASPQI